MASFYLQTLRSFQEELEKDAGALDLARRAGGYLARQGTTAGAGAAFGGISGAGLGGLVGGIKSYREAKEQGGTGGDAARAALMGGLGGLQTGAMVGAGLGGAAGLAGGARARGLVRNLSGREGATGAISRFGERQAHGLTGALPENMTRPEAMAAMRMGSHQTRGALQAAEGRMLHSLQGGSAKDFKKFKAETENLKKTLGHQEALEGMGATSLPGYLKSLASRDAGKVLKHGLGEGWHSQGTGLTGAAGRAVTFGLPAYAVGKAAFGEDDPEMGRGQRIGQALGGATLGLAGPMPMIGQGVLTGLMAKGTESAGRGVDYLRNRVGKKDLTDTLGAKGALKSSLKPFTPATGPEPEEGTVSPQGVEHQYGNDLRAMT